MKMSELSRASGVPVPTIKFYLREHLLPAGPRHLRHPGAVRRGAPRPAAAHPRARRRRAAAARRRPRRPGRRRRRRTTPPRRPSARPTTRSRRRPDRAGPPPVAGTGSRRLARLAGESAARLLCTSSKPPWPRVDAVGLRPSARSGCASTRGPRSTSPAPTSPRSRRATRGRRPVRGDRDRAVRAGPARAAPPGPAARLHGPSEAFC